MDFTNRSVRHPSESQPASSPAPKPASKLSKLKSQKKWLNITYVVLLFSGTILVVAVLASLILSTTKKESQYVDSSRLQAVFLNNGQVYFGNISVLNNQYLKLNNIYYLRVNQQVQPGQQANQNDVSLAKLGCELHGPEDQMVVNREQVTFWENLKDDGQVTNAVKEFVKANPNGQDCQQAAQESSSESSGNTGDSGNNSTTGTTNNSSSNSSTNNTNNSTSNNP